MDSEEMEEVLADKKLMLSLALLRKVYLRFSVAFRSFVNLHLTEIVPMIKEMKKAKTYC